MKNSNLLPAFFFLVLLFSRPAEAQVAYYTNFDSMTAGAIPSGWTQINTPVSSSIVVVTGSTLTAPNSLGTASTVDGQTLLYTNGAAFADGAYQCSYIWHSQNVPGLIARSDSTGANYYLVLAQGNSIIWYKRVAGGFTSLATVSLGTSFVEGNKVSAKLQVVGSTLSYKLWLYGGTEPAFQSTLTDTSITAAGIGGVRFAVGSTANTLPVVDDFYIGTANTAFVPPSASLSVSPASLTAGTTGNTVTLTDANIVAGTTFSVASTGTGAAITAGATATGAGSAALTVTAGTAGTLTYSCSADLSSATQVVAASGGAATTLPMTDTNLLAGRSPYTWSGGIMLSAGAYLKASLNYPAAGPLTLNLLTGGYSGVAAGSRPAIAWSVDGGPKQTLLLSDANLQGTAPNQSVQIAASLGSGAHSLLLYYKSDDPHIDQWNAPVEAVNIASLGVPSGATTSAPALLPARVYYRSDSIGGGEGALAINGAGGDYSTSGDATAAWPALVAGALNAEYGQVGYGGIGWLGTSAGNVPGTASSWTSLYSGVSRLTGGLLSPVPTQVITNLGTNGNTTGTLATSGSTGTVRGDMAALRAATGAACLNIYLVPFGQFARAGHLNDLSYYGGGTSGSNGYTQLAIGPTTIYKAVSDPNTWVVDLGAGAAAGLSSAGTPTLQAYDGLHPTALTHARLSALITQALQGASGTVIIARRRSIQ